MAIIYEGIMAEVAEETGLPKILVYRAYLAFWKAVREYVKAQPLKEDLTDEEFKKLRPNVNIPSIGKLCVTLKRYQGMKSYFEQYYKNYKNKKDNHVEN